jgi:hypothetical protein
LLLLTALLLPVVNALAQTQRGKVVSRETAEPLYHVTVVNAATGENSFTDNDGNYVIPAKAGDVIAFSLSSYHTIDTTAGPGHELNIELSPLTIKLPAYTLRGLTQYQQDSIEMTTLYSKELNTRAVKPGFSSANGGGFSGLIGGPVQKLSKSYRQNKRFKENFRKDMEQRYIDSKYTPVLVNALTGLAGDNLAVFMNSYPMEYGFARTATDLEIKMWIRNNFRDYERKTPANRPQPKHEAAK